MEIGVNGGKKQVEKLARRGRNLRFSNLRKWDNAY